MVTQELIDKKEKEIEKEQKRLSAQVKEMIDASMMFT